VSTGGKRHGSAVEAGAKRPVVGLLGLFGVGNLGNDGSFEVGLAMVGEHAPRAEVVCITSAPKNITRRFGVASMQLREPRTMPSWMLTRGRWRPIVLPLAEIRRWVGTYRAARGMDAIVIPGTGVLDDFGLRPQGVPYILFRWAVCSRLARTPFSFVGIGAGPIKHPASRRLMGWTARLATHRSYRDRGSASYMATLGAPGHYTPDIVFADAHLRSEPEPCPSRPFGVIGVGIMSYAGWTDHVADGAVDVATPAENKHARIVDLVGRLLDDGNEVSLVVGAESDLATVATVVAAVEASGRGVDGRVHTPEIMSLGDLCRELAKTDGAIVTRYHNLVCSLIAGRACVSIGYEARFDELTQAAGLPAFGHRAESFETEQVVADLAAARAEHCDRSPQVADRLVEFDELVHRDFAAVLENL
jgi:polysaccharide pyruvyl transferase WcaK-like protein